ncbi:hypothetical protein WH52_11320 [Tenacibaculum holothuriorum]|uniref:Hemin receptor n=1 Tax=Tenacibaculum holothuriorum TaxID=1635173 RepID=A0A1Y2PAH4_9FLAO|nr:outer membrane protein transport protein [Tenacibaculum holothuriorum]OSY87455.1 hypothetical protein WH52_11320 [Tenacibaculum holothuriorum]
MKRFFIIATLVAGTLTSFSQSLGYNDLGIIFSQDNNNGTARFNAMSGAFGALGGDVSSIGINPAGGAVARKSKLSFTMGNRNTDIAASYYGNTLNNQDDFFNVTQAGAILSFDSAYDSDWNRFALSFNYRLKNDFDGSFSVRGNSGQAFFNEHPDDPATPRTQFTNAREQSFTSTLNGESSVFSFGFSAVHQNKLFVGATVNLHDVRLGQRATLNEINEDGNGNTLTAFNEQISRFEGQGFSLGVGFIYKMHQNLRLGLSYETPTWYTEVLEESNLAVFDPNDSTYDHWLGYTRISATNITPNVDSGEEFNTYAFRLKTPGKLTASGAILFDKKGLISIDYTFKDYKNTNFSNGNFTDVNNNFNNDFRSTHAVNIGTEWRFDKMSIRGGYHYEQSPYKDALDSDNLKGFSAGLGYNFGNMNFGLSYSKTESTSPYRLYNTDRVNVNPAELNINTARIMGTLTINL